MGAEPHVVSLPDYFTSSEIQRLTEAVQQIMDQSGWGEIIIEIKGGRIDVIRISSSVLVREKSIRSLDNQV